MAALAIVLLLWCVGVNGMVFTVVNSCSETIWVGVLTGNGALLNDGSFALIAQHSEQVTTPVDWSGCFWGCTGCNFDASGKGLCDTSDCGRGLKCDGAGGVPPATLIEFTIGDLDYYDMSLVDGFNVPLKISMAGGTGNYTTTECVADIRNTCPDELKVMGSNGQVISCKSACEEFGSPEYCCTGDHNTPQMCPPTKYLEVFKAACPTAYSYAYDDSTSLSTCTHPDYTITFCP